MELYLTGPSTIEGSLIQGNADGVYVNGAGVTFGDANLDDHLGNIVTASTDQAFYGVSVAVVGNTFSNNQGRNASVHLQNAGVFSDNLVFGNSNGVETAGGAATITGNFLHDNGGYGLSIASDSALISGNTILNHNVGVFEATSGATFTHNVIANDVYAGLQLENAVNVLVSNNTFYEPSAGLTKNPADPNYGAGAVVLDRSSTGTRLLDNIIFAGAGVGVFVSDASQAGLASNYNLFATGAGGRVGSWQGLNQTNLAQWRASTGGDAQLVDRGSAVRRRFRSDAGFPRQEPAGQLPWRQSLGGPRSRWAAGLRRRRLRRRRRAVARGRRRRSHGAARRRARGRR